jgi:hypothetical protein
MRARRHDAALRAGLVLLAAALIGLVAGLEASAFALPLLAVLGATIGGCAGADRLLLLAERVAAWRGPRRRRRSARRLRAGCYQRTGMGDGRLTDESSASRAPPLAGVA